MLPSLLSSKNFSFTLFSHTSLHSVGLRASATPSINITDTENAPTTNAGEKISHITFLNAKALLAQANLFLPNIQSRNKSGEKDIYIHNRNILTAFTTIKIIIGIKNNRNIIIFIIAFIAAQLCLNFLLCIS
jgi:hypothetical protein